MPRRKQDCPKRMKWDGEEGEAEEEDGCSKGEEEEEGESKSGDEVEPTTGGGSMSPNSVLSVQATGEEDGVGGSTSPTPGDVPSPTTSPRSATNEYREVTSPRCNSTGSMDSLTARCASRDSLLSERTTALLHRSSTVPMMNPVAALSPVGVALPSTLPAASLLPPQSAAMAAYLNAVAQQRLMMTSPLQPSSAFHPATISPIGASNSLHSPNGIAQDNTTALDFSSSKLRDSDSDVVVVNLCNKSPPVNTSEGTPLDLSVGGSRKRSSPVEISQQPPVRKPSKLLPPAHPWPTHLPYFAAAAMAAANLSPSSKSTSSTTVDLWNGKLKHTSAPSAVPLPPPSEASKALEKMSELSKLGGEDLFRAASGGGGGDPIPGTNRHSAWQSHWLSKGADQAKDVLKCVWCKQSFPSLAAMTTHMKEAKHCGVNVPPMVPPHIPTPQIPSPSITNSSTSSSSTKNSDLNMLIKETMPLPRKLVRGQDVWLGKGAEQTRQILKCMWCGQSFRSLAEMTSHMQQTQHYTNIISQEQIISWRSTDDAKSSSSGNSHSSQNHQMSGSTPSSHVSAVLTCKVCDQAFSSLKELSNHMVKNSHYKEHIMRSITESGGRRRQTREKRKKSLPVRKLLELERAQHEFKNGDCTAIEKASSRITCEKCGLKIDTALFVDHIRQCVGGHHQRNFLKSALMSANNNNNNSSNNNNTITPTESPTDSKTPIKLPKTPSPQHLKSPDLISSAPKDLSATSETNNNSNTNNNNSSNNSSSPSVLNAIEKLIEKSFDSRTRQNASFPGHGTVTAPIGSSILKRLGIDESVDYTKPLVDAHTMNLLKSYQQQHHYVKRERSGSESSSISERCSSRIDSMEPPSTPIKKEPSPEACIENCSVKKEPDDDEDAKRETDDDCSSICQKEDEDEEKKSPSRSTNSASPANSDRSGTPRSGNGERKSHPSSGSLGALNSMFNNLSGSNSDTNTTASPSSNGGGGKRTSSHPLAALQKLCDKTETHSNNSTNGQNSRTGSLNSSSSSTAPGNNNNNSSSNNNNNNNSNPTTTTVSNQLTPPLSSTMPGAILAFSWACNDAVMTSDSIMKCAFCDTPFISKGAYRHHLSKMHFVKDGVIPDPIKSPAHNHHHHSHSHHGDSSAVGIPLKSTANLPLPPPPTTNGPTPQTGGSPPHSQTTPTSSANFDESPHSKFLKYTELAKQLSSKYV